jgi:hypothetical protein
MQQKSVTKIAIITTENTADKNGSKCDNSTKNCHHYYARDEIIL